MPQATSRPSIRRPNTAFRYYLLANIYGFGAAGTFDLQTLAKHYAGANATPTEIQAYLDGWSRWSGGSLGAATKIHLAKDDELLPLAKAEFAHEAAAISPLRDDQILYGFSLARGRG